MKIAYLLGSLNRGGTETLMLDVFRNARQYQLDAIGVYRKGGQLEPDFIQSGISMFKLTVTKNPVRYVFRLRKLLQQNNITAVHAQQPIDALFAWLACQNTGIKLILTFHGYDFDTRKSGLVILKFIIKRTDVNLFVSKAQREYYEQKYSLTPEKQQVVYNGVSFEKLDTILDYHISNLRD